MKLLLSLAAALTALTATAGNTSGITDGYLDRGLFYYRSGWTGPAVDQLSHYESIADPTEESELALALAAARDADPRAIDLLERFMARYPQSTSCHMVAVVTGNCYMDRGDWAEACRWYSSVGDGSLDPDTDAARLLETGIAMMMLGRRDEAERILSRLDGTSQESNALFYRGYIAYVDRDYPRAMTLLERVTSTAMPAAMAQYYLCQIYYLDGDNNRALSRARRLTENTGVPQEYRAEASRIAGEALYNNGESDQAIPYLKRYVRECGTTPLPSAMYILGMSQYREADYRGAIETLKTPSELNDAMGQSALLTIGQCYMQSGDMSSAIIALNKAVEIDADRAVTEEAYYNYCVARSDGGRVPFGSSVAVFEDFTRRFPSSRYTAKVSEYLAYGYMSDDNYEAALKSIDRISNPSPRIIAARQQVLYTLGARDVAAGRYDDAIRYLDQARAITGQDAATVTECELLLGDCHYRKGDYSRAATCYSNYLSRASAANPNKTLARYDLGYALFACKQYSKARTQFEQVINTPGISAAMEADATSRIADTYYAGRDLDNALKQYERAARIDPTSADYPLYQYASMWGWKGNSKAQIEGLQAMIDRFPRSPLVPQAMLDIAETYTAGNRIDDAIDTYRLIERDYGSTDRGRQAMLLMGTLQASEGRAGDAYDTYSRLIRQHSPSSEASMAARRLQTLAAEQGRLDDYVAFMSSVPNAPAVDPSEIDRATFAAARTPAQWEQYLSRYPHGEHAPQALLLLARSAMAANDNDMALNRSTRLVTEYPEGEYITEGLSIKADAEMALGMIPEALEDYRALEMRASDPATLNHSRLGHLKAARDMGRHNEVIELADLLLSSSSSGSGQQSDISFMKAVSLNATGRGEEAAAIWRSLSTNPADLTGAKSLYYLAQYQYDSGDTKGAWKSVNTLIDSNTPHSYWLARGYILTSDLYRAQGDTFEADEYLKSLRDNYPGSEPDIPNMIESRLNASK